MSVVDGVSLAHTGFFATSFTARDDRVDQLHVLADVRAHVLAVHVRARQVQLERVGALLLARVRERLPVGQLLVVLPEPAMIEATSTLCGIGLLDPRAAAAPTSRAACRR